VDKEEYKEFLNLGHGEIFSLELDRCGGGVQASCATVHGVRMWGGVRWNLYRWESAGLASDHCGCQMNLIIIIMLPIKP
jgi:hypothetical protein